MGKDVPHLICLSIILCNFPVMWMGGLRVAKVCLCYSPTAGSGTVLKTASYWRKTITIVVKLPEIFFFYKKRLRISSFQLSHFPASICLSTCAVTTAGPVFCFVNIIITPYPSPLSLYILGLSDQCKQTEAVLGMGNCLQD